MLSKKIPVRQQPRIITLEQLPEGPQRDHVERKVNKIRMYETVSKETVELIIAFDHRRVKDQVVHDLVVAEGGN